MKTRPSLLLGLLLLLLPVTLATSPPPPPTAPFNGLSAFSAFDSGTSAAVGLLQPLDLNGDAVLDVVLTQTASLVWLPGAMVRTIDTAQSATQAYNGYTVGDYVPLLPAVSGLTIAAVALGDVYLPGDNWPDVVVARNTSLIVAGNDGALADGSNLAVFPAATQFTAYSTPDQSLVTLVGTGDIDGDGLADIVFVTWPASGTSGGTIKWLRNTYALNGGWATTASTIAGSLPSGTAPSRLLVTDLDLDGALDVVLVTGSAVTWYHNQYASSGSFGASTSVGTATATISPLSVVTVDFNADGLLDVTASTASTTYVWLSAAASGSHTAVTTTSNTCTAIATGDYDLDGYSDLACQSAVQTSGTHEYCVTWLHSTSAGTVLAPAMPFSGGSSALCVSTQTPLLQSTGIAVVDADADGLLDMFVADVFNLYLSINRNQAVFANGLSSTSGAATVLTLNITGQTAFQRIGRTLVDMDGDGKLDLAFLTVSVGASPTQYTLRWSKGEGSNVFNQTISTALTYSQSPGNQDYAYYGTNDLNPLLADIDMDGTADYISPDGDVHLNGGKAAFSAAPYGSSCEFGLPVYAGVIRRAPSLQGINPPDVVFVQANGQLCIAWNSDFSYYLGLGTPSRPTLPCGNNPQPIVVADLNNDGFADLACSASGTSIYWISNSRAGATSSTFSGTPVLVLALDPQRPLGLMRAVDVDGDGFLDLAFADMPTFAGQDTRATTDRQVGWMRNIGSTTGTFSLANGAPQAIATCHMVSDSTSLGPSDSAIVIDMEWQDIDGDGLADATILCGSMCSGFTTVCSNYAVYSIKNLGNGLTGTPSLLASNTCMNLTLSYTGSLTTGDSVGSGMPSVFYYSTCPLPSNTTSAAPGVYGTIVGIANRGRTLTLNVAATVATAAALATTSTTSYSASVASFQATQIELVLSQQCQLAAGGAVQVTFANNTLPSFISLDYNANPMLRLCSLSFVGTSEIPGHLLSIPCTSPPCLKVNSLPLGRAVSFWYANLTAPGNGATALTVSHSSGRVIVWSTFIYGAVTVTNSFVLFMAVCNLQASNVTYAGGPPLVSVAGGQLQFNQVTVLQNTLDPASSTGGAGINMVGTGSGAMLWDSIFMDLHALGGYGGAIYVEDATLTVWDTQFDANSAFNGGALYATGATVPFIFGASFTGNTATVHGGAIFLDTFAAGNPQPQILQTSFASSNVAETGLGQSLYYFDDSALPNAPGLTNVYKVGSRFEGVETSPASLDQVTASEPIETGLTIVLVDVNGHNCSAPYDGYVSATGSCTVSVFSSQVAGASLSGNIGSIVDDACELTGLVVRAMPGTSVVLAVTANPYTDRPSTSAAYVDVTIADCVPGQQVFQNSSCIPCTSGTYSSSYNVQQCQSCVAGTYPNVPNSGATECLPCAAGYVTATAGLTVCSACGSGLVTSDNIHCVPCSNGSIPNSDSSACVLCGAGTVALSGASQCSSCGSGLYTVDNVNCIKCPNGTVPNLLASGCVLCATGSVALSGASQCTTCGFGTIADAAGVACATCSAGSAPNAPLRDECTECGDGYQAASGADQCTQCGSGLYTADHVTCNQCAPGSVPNVLQNGCDSCATGYIASPGQASCLPCASYQFTNDSVNCYTCSAGFIPNAYLSGCDACPAGYISQPGQTACFSCYSIGRYTLDGVTCLQCNASSVPNLLGSGCTPCVAGTYSQPGFTSCQQCNTGQVTTDGETCQDCPEGTIPDQVGSGCVVCSVGMIGVPGATQCASCGFGKITTDNVNCTFCPNGTVPNALNNGCSACTGRTVAVSGQAQCQSCASNEYTPDQIQCLVCGDGYVPDPFGTGCVACTGNTVALSGQAQCQACASNQYTPDQINCLLCADGQIPNLLGTGCTNCTGRTVAAAGQSQCQSCSSSEYTPDQVTCLTCIAGQVPNPFGTGCVNCTGNTFAASGQASCQACPSNQYTADQVTCQLCGDGQIPNVLGTGCTNCTGRTVATSGQSQCQSCSSGQYTPDQIQCLACADGFVPDPFGTSCVACTGNTVAASGQASCQACPSNQYTPDQISCLLCDDGQVPNLLGTGCTNCTGRTIATAGQTQCLSCLSSQYTSDQIHCSECADGSVPDAYGTGCVACTGNTFAISGQAQCQSCPSNQYTPDQINCLLCSDGQVPNLLGTGCTNCTGSTVATSGQSQCQSCPSNQYTPDQINCLLCSDGQIPDPFGTGCTNCTGRTVASSGQAVCQSCSTSQYTSDHIHCLSCDDGQVPDPFGATCVMCTGNTVASSGESQCHACPSNEYTPDQINCLLCDDGQVPNALGTGCDNCTGHTVATAGQSQCQPCASNRYTPDQINCLLCPDGEIPDPFGVTCVNCSDNSVAFSGDSLCLACPPGAIKLNGTTCQQCSSGLIPSPTYDSCEACPAGYVVAASLTKCQPCQASQITTDGVTCTYCDDGSAPVNNVCKPCGAGQVATSGQASCSPCAPGLFTADSIHCGQCPSGTVPAATGASCSPCGPGTVALSGQTVCSACSAGFYTSNNINCTQCSPGQQPNTNQTGCLTCPAGTASPSGITCGVCISGYSATAGSTDCKACETGLICGTASGQAIAQPGYYVVTGTQGDLFAAQCPFDWCNGGTTTDANTCAAHHLPNSTLCGECDTDNYYFMWGGDCSFCPPDQVAGAIVALYVVIFLYVSWLYYFSPGTKASGVMGTVVFVFQTLGLISSVYIVGGDETAATSVSWLSAFLLEISFGECPGQLIRLNPDLPAFYVWFWLKLAQPVIMVAMLLLLAATSALLGSFALPDAHIWLQTVLPRFLRKYDFVEGKFDLSPMSWRVSKTVINILMFCYIPVLKATFTVFHVIALPGDETVWVVASDPSILVTDSLYTQHLIIAGVVSAIYLPLPFVLVYLAYAKHWSVTAANDATTDGVPMAVEIELTKVDLESITTAALDDKAQTAPAMDLRTMEVYGMILRPFTEKLWWTWLLLEVRKVLVLALVVFLGSFQVDLQNTLLAVLFCVLLLAIDVLRPFQEPFSHLCESAGLVVLVIAVQSRDSTVTGYYFVWTSIAAYALFFTANFVSRYLLPNKSRAEFAEQ